MTCVSLPCNFCGYQAMDQHSLDLHLLQSHPQPRFSCEICNSVFRSKDVCVDHIMEKHSSKTFECKGCSFAAENRAAVMLHLWTGHRRQRRCDMEGRGGQTVAQLRSARRNART